jgi:hypothetical protein
MDIESLAKELILKNMNPEQQLAVLEGIKTSVAQAKEVQKQRIGENVGLVVDALKKIESDIRSRYDEVGNAIEHRVNAIKDGRDGINGQDGKNGKDGLNGKQGLQGIKGKDGRDGRDGTNGVDGVSVTSAHIDFDGSLIIGLSSGVELNVGEVLAPSLAESIKVITNGGGTSQSVLDTLASLQSQITNLIPSQTGNSGKFLTTNGTALSWSSVAGGLSYQGTWNASTNTPTLASSTGTNGYYYIVATAGSTNLNGITDWQVGDWLMFNGSVWQKIDQTNSVTSVNSKTGAVVLNNVDISGFATIAAAGTTTTLTSSSAPNYVVTGSGGQAIQLPDATTLVNGVLFSFNNNQSSGTIVVKNNSSTTIATIQSGGYVSIILLSNSIAAGSWDVHNYAPSNVSWSTNTFDYPGSITSASWNGNTVAYNRGGTGQSSAFVAGGVVYGSTTSALAVTSAGTSGQVLTSGGTGAPTWSTPTTGTVTSVAATAGTGISISGSPITSSGTLTITNTAPDQTVALTAGTGITTSGTYPNFTITNSSPDRTVALTGSGTTTVTGTYPNFTISSSDAYVGTVTSVTGTSPVASSGGTTPAISLASGYGDTQNPYASKTANYVLAAPNGSAGAPTFRAIVAADIPTLNQNTTGTAANITATSNSTLTTLSSLSLPGSQVSGNISGNSANVTGTVAIANGGTGQTTANTAFNALAPSQATNSGKYLTTDGTNSSWASVVAGASITNDTTTSTNVYPLFAAATSGTPTTIYTGNTKYLYKPSTGELTVPAPIASNGIVVNNKTVSVSYTIASGNSAMSAGPITLSSGVSVTISSGSRWVVL